MDEPYLLAAARYVERNPVKANLVADAADWPWSSAGADLSACDDHLVQVAPLLAIIDDWRAFLDSTVPEDHLGRMCKHVPTETEKDRHNLCIVVCATPNLKRRFRRGSPFARGGPARARPARQGAAGNVSAEITSSPRGLDIAENRTSRRPSLPEGYRQVRSGL